MHLTPSLLILKVFQVRGLTEYKVVIDTMVVDSQSIFE